jgi:uncharacterized protein (TIGR04255 family)
MTDTHRVFPNAPLALVAVEVRFPSPATDRPLPMPVQRAFRDKLGADWVIESFKTQKFDFAFGPVGQGQQSAQQVVVPRFTVRDRTTAVAISDESLTVETTSYRHYHQFREMLNTAFAAAAEIVRPDGVARMGMRYIDEIRVPDFPDTLTSDWKEWLEPSLLPAGLDHMVEDGFAVSGWEGAVQYETHPAQRLILRYGARTGYAVSPDGPLKRRFAPPPGPFFVLDFDSFWQPPDIPEFDPGMLLTTCDELRNPVRTLFDLLISDRLRNEVFMKEPAHG